MIEAPPAAISLAPDIPQNFSIEAPRRAAAHQRIVPACPRAADNGSGEIVVCGRRDDRRYRLEAPSRAADARMEEINDSLSIKVGSARIGSFKDSSGQRRLGLNVRF
ncbi:hypothetical protein [Allosphingosinicella deserti]|uniref:Uncharacterized protein n=1 Tax=Allosphingosinicella deserti TaxID=2116704 RepID=A0A2P7QRC2_9SPHN|nr:hypothetical protein [Sphingomonas deserti]PSJ40480.1 hypothetical protein C7I55_09085 [Sphingomonas deserti]